MRGHIVQRGKRYYAVIYEGTDPATGKRIRRWYPAGDTRKGAEKTLTDLVKRMHDGDYRAPDRITLGDYLVERWLPTKRAQLRRSTFDSYGRNVRNHVVPRIGDIPLQKLTPEDLDEFYAKLLVDGSSTATAPACRSRPSATSTPSSARRSPTPTARAACNATSPTSPTRRSSRPRRSDR